MKVIAFILSAYLLLLFAIPCCTFDNCPGDEIAMEADRQEADDPASPAEGDCGSCSPFFTCTGCSGFTFSPENNNPEIILLFSGQQYAGYILSSIPDVQYDFWQPPKLT